MKFFPILVDFWSILVDFWDPQKPPKRPNWVKKVLCNAEPFLADFRGNGWFIRILGFSWFLAFFGLFWPFWTFFGFLGNLRKFVDLFGRYNKLFGLMVLNSLNWLLVLKDWNGLRIQEMVRKSSIWRDGKVRPFWGL